MVLEAATGAGQGRGGVRAGGVERGGGNGQGVGQMRGMQKKGAKKRGVGGPRDKGDAVERGAG